MKTAWETAVLTCFPLNWAWEVASSLNVWADPNKYHQNKTVISVRKKETIIFGEVMNVLKLDGVIIFSNQIASFITFITFKIRLG
jgi:hypothetical protein